MSGTRKSSRLAKSLVKVDYRDDKKAKSKRLKGKLVKNQTKSHTTGKATKSEYFSDDSYVIRASQEDHSSDDYAVDISDDCDYSEDSSDEVENKPKLINITQNHTKQYQSSEDSDDISFRDQPNPKRSKRNRCEGTKTSKHLVTAKQEKKDDKSSDDDDDFHDVEEEDSVYKEMLNKSKDQARDIHNCESDNEVKPNISNIKNPANVLSMLMECETSVQDYNIPTIETEVNGKSRKVDRHQTVKPKNKKQANPRTRKRKITKASDVESDDDWEEVNIKQEKSKNKKRKITGSDDDFVETPKAKNKNKKETKKKGKRKRVDSESLEYSEDEAKHQKKRALTEEEKEIKRFTNRCTKDRTSCIEQCTLLTSISFLCNVMKVSQYPLLQSLFMSVMPHEMINDSIRCTNKKNLDFLKQTLRWYKSVFKFDSYRRYENSGKKALEVLCAELLSSKFTIYEHVYVMGFCIVLLILGLDTVRFVGSLYVPSLDKIRSASRLSPKARLKFLKDDEAMSYKDMVEDVSFWLEVLHETTIIAIDVCNEKVDNDRFIEFNCIQSPGYVVSITTDLTILDSTAKYSLRWSHIHRKARLLNFEFWDSFMLKLEEENHIVISKHNATMKKIMVDRGFPPSVGAFKHNLVFALEKDLLKVEAIYPKNAPVLGEFKTHDVYSRDNIRSLKQIIVIKKDGRQLIDGEIPYKIVKQKIFYDRWPGDDRWKDQPLYGQWQTERYQAQTAENGVVPRNEFGNVEMFKPWMLPKGTSHVPLPGSYALARRLGIDAAHAVTHFDFPRGRAVPVMTGVVVCQEKADLLRNAWVEYNANQTIKAEEKRVKKIYDSWKTLIRGLLIKKKISDKYQGMFDNPKPGTKSGHIHKFPMKSQRKDKVTGLLVQKCRCGLVVPVDSCEENL